MSDCSCERQDGYANCCRNKSLAAMIESRNLWVENLQRKLSAAEKERDELRGDRDTFLAEHDENVRLHFENVDLKEKLAVAEKIGEGWSELLKKEGELHEASVHRNHGEMRGLRSKLAVAVGVLEEFSYRHFDGSKTDYACGDGCDMGDSGHPTDERGHDMDCIFRKATEALKVINGGE